MKYILIILLFASCNNNNVKVINDYQQRIDSLTRVADSLRWELLPTQIELGRYQVAYRIFLERNPKAAEQYGTIISEETE